MLLFLALDSFSMRLLGLLLRLLLALGAALGFFLVLIAYVFIYLIFDQPRASDCYCRNGECPPCANNCTLRGWVCDPEF